jgi:alpha-tubulin suppressor-like RCC1 family protein
MTAATFRGQHRSWRLRIAAVGAVALVAASPLAVSVLPSAVGGAGIAAAAVGAPGTLYAWGDNSYGELGSGGTPPYSTAPIAVGLPAGVEATSVDGGNNTVLALGSDGNVYAWGENTWGQLGNGTTSNSGTPVKVSLPAGVTATAVSEGYWDSLALGADGSVYAWGHNLDGELGDGSTADSSVPVKVSLPTGVTATAVSAGWYNNMALGSDGSVYAWGDNTFGELGDTVPAGSNPDTPVKVSLPAGVTVTAVSAGWYTDMALGSDGNVYAWGDNAEGQLGNGTTSSGSDVPVKVSLPAGVTATAVSIGFDGLAVGSDGSVYVWGGQDNYGQLGNGTTNASTDVPVKVSLPAGVTATAVSKDNNNALALGSDGSVYAWGYNVVGELGNGTTTNSDVPVQVNLPAGMIATMVAGSWNTSLATLSAQASTGVAPAFTADSPPTAGTAGTPYTYAFAASGNPAPTFSVNSGSLPSGLTLDSATGALSGTPTTAGSFTFTVEAANGVTPAAVSPSITVTIATAGVAPAFTADSPATAGTAGTPYTYAFAASGNPAPTFSVNSGSLPGGLTLDSATGALSGTPTTAGSFTFTVEAANGVTPAAVSPSITITVTPLTICARGAKIPPGYVVTSLVPNFPSCGANNFAGFNAYRISPIAAGDVICWGAAFEPAEPVPAGYVATAMQAAPQCGSGTNFAGLNAYKISPIAAGDVICSGALFEPVEPVPPGYVATAMLNAPQCGSGTNLAGFNAYQIGASSG